MFEAGHLQFTGSVLWLRRGVRQVHAEIMDVEIPPLPTEGEAIFSFQLRFAPHSHIYGSTVLDTSFNIFKCKYLSDAVVIVWSCNNLSVSIISLAHV